MSARPMNGVLEKAIVDAVELANFARGRGRRISLRAEMRGRKRCTAGRRARRGRRSEAIADLALDGGLKGR